MKVYRQDNLDAALSRPVRGAGGAVFIEGFAARPGIYVYVNADGKKHRELVPRAQLWNPDSMLTLCRAPLTLGHPDELVTDENVTKYGVGDVGEEIIEGEGGFVRVKLAVRSRVAKDALKNGIVQLSPGYLCTIDPTPGTDPEFGDYDAVQVFREYNHLAIVDEARGGDQCRVRIDGVSVAIMEPPVKKTLKSDDVKKIEALTGTVLTSLGQIQTARRIVDSLSDVVETQKSLREFWDDFWTVYDAFHGEANKILYADEDMEPSDKISALEKLASELADEIGKMGSKLDETVKLDAAPPPPPAMTEEEKAAAEAAKAKTAEPPPAETPPAEAPPAEGEGGEPPPAETPPAEGTPPAEEPPAAAPAEEVPPPTAAATPAAPAPEMIEVIALLRLIAMSVGIVPEGSALPTSATKVDGVAHDRLTWYKNRVAIIDRADKAGVGYTDTETNEQIARKVLTAYNADISGLPEIALVPLARALPDASVTKPPSAHKDDKPPAATPTIYGK